MLPTSQTSQTPVELPLLLSEAQKLDLQRRLDAIDADPTRGSTWDAVKARLLSTIRDRDGRVV